MVTELSFTDDIKLYLDFIDNEDCRLLIKSLSKDDINDNDKYMVHFTYTEKLESIIYKINTYFNIVTEIPEYAIRFNSFIINKEFSIKGNNVLLLSLEHNYRDYSITIKGHFENLIVPKRSLLLYKTSDLVQFNNSTYNEFFKDKYVIFMTYKKITT